MQRVLRQFPDIHSYLRGFPNILDSCSRQCDHCGAEDALVGHGTYRRSFVTFGFKRTIRIQRLRCTKCPTTISLVPLFLRCRSPYAAEVVRQVRTARARGAPLYTIPASLAAMGVAVKYATIRSWAARAA